MDGNRASRGHLTAPQRRAADAEASVWVSASAGTGKTKVLTDRVLNLLLSGTPPSRILCLTFTKAAAAEMRERIAHTLGAWATADDKTLNKALLDLAGTSPDDERRAAARRLFAAVLDVPGGMHIMTIHAFCQSVLKRFPLEAGLAPHFTVMDERDAAELMDEARKELLARARMEGGALIADALAEVSRHVTEDGFAELLRTLAAERARVAAIVARGAAAEAEIWQAVRLAPGGSAAAILAAACADGACDDAALAAAAAAMQRGGARDGANGAAIAEWLAAPAAERAARLDGYLAAYFTDGGKGGRRARLLHREALALAPDAEAALTAEAARLEAVRGRLAAATAAEATVALLRLGGAMLAIYEAHKARRALLDYDDLILRTRDLLARQGSAAWVLFKLDGGIDHILIDEAQDTNPEQWEIVRLLAEEFFAGEGARDEARTVFAVGDPKQSIYSFQRAAPQEFERMREYFAERARAAARRWDNVPLEMSFRSTRAVLNLVDAVFARDAARDGVVPPGLRLRHLVHRMGEAGLVELWPPCPVPERAEVEDWALPVEQMREESPRARLAVFIADRIQRWRDTGELLESQGRPIRPSDIMVLVPRRGPFVEELVWALKQRDVPVAGVDRMVLTEQLAVMDLMALGRFLLMPEDDLNLAALLKSPLCGLSEDQLFRLASARRGSLWRELRARRDEEADFARVADGLASLLARADFVPPYELYAELLGAGGGRRRLLARLGREAEDPIDEFLALALAYERAHTPSLQGFLHWLEAGRTEVKRELEQASRDEVRVMTVHGAKGLEAPIVFLPDTMQSADRLGSARPSLLWPEGRDILLWPPRKEHEAGLAAAARARAAELRDQEYRRLLYVALTRAAERIYVCGWESRNGAPDGCWYKLVSAGMADAGAVVPDILVHEPGGWAGAGCRLVTQQSGRARKPAAAPAAADAEPAPAWLGAPAPREPAPPRPLAPSRPAAPEPPVRSPFSGADGGIDDGARFRRGLLVHKLLEVLPEVPEPERAARCRAYLDAAARELEPAARDELAGEVLAVLAHPDFARFFGPGSRGEVPIAGTVAGQVISGQVDRLLVTAGSVHVLDYKSNRPAPRRESEVAAIYLRQMAAYRALLGQVYQDRPVACALLWTDGPRLMSLSPAILDRHAPAGFCD